jgi:hypothetical protein
VGQDGLDMHLIWVNGEGKYFCKRGWTSHFGKHEVICPSGKIWAPVGWVEPFAKPIIGARSMMGIASLNPSYALPAIASQRVGANGSRERALDDRLRAAR